MREAELRGVNKYGEQSHTVSGRARVGHPLFSQTPAIDSISSETLLQRIAHATASASPSIVVYVSGLFGLLVPLIARASLSAVSSVLLNY